MKKRILQILSLLIISILLFACGSSTKENVSEAASEKLIGESESNIAQKTIMFYIIGSDLEENTMGGTEMVAAVSKIKNQKNLNLIIMTGGSVNENGAATRQDEDYKGLYGEFYNINWEVNQIWEVRDGIKPVEENFGSENMTKCETLEKFLKYVKKNFPANTYDIIFSDHGGAALYSFGTDTRYQEEGGCISLKDLEVAFRNSGIKFTTVGFDACLMASFELMCILEPYSDYLIAAEETSFGGWDYSFLDEVANDASIDPVTYGKSIVDKFIAATNVNANSLGVFSLKGFREKVDNSLTEFCKNMNKYLSEDDFLIDLYRILNSTIGLGYTSINDIRDLRDFLDWIENIENAELPEELKTSAGTLWKNTEEFIIYFKTRKAKNEDGSERTGGLNFVFPNKNVYYDDDESDEALLSMENYPESLNEDFRLMFKLAFLRKSLVSALKDNSYEANDNEVKKALNVLCDRAYEKYKIPKPYIDSIKNNIVPLLASNRIKAGSGGNISFEKEVKNDQVSFNLMFDNSIAWMLYEPNAIARTYSIEGKELTIGNVSVVPKSKTVQGNKNIWHIVPEEDRWFTINSGNYEYLVQFIVTDEDENNDNRTTMNNLFDSSIVGFIPAILKRYEDDTDDDNIIQIYVEFAGSRNKGNILGFTRYDQNSNMSAKEIENFKAGDKIKIIANFEDFNKTKDITYLAYSEIPVDNIEVSRGYTSAQNVYFKYSAEDIYGVEYDFDIDNQFAFELGGKDDYCLYATFPSTWTDATIDTSDSSFESWSVFGQHKEKINVNLFDVTNDANFANVEVGGEFPDATAEYLSKDNSFEYVTDIDGGWLTGSKDASIPFLSIEGLDKNEKFLSKKFVFFVMDERKFLIELTTLVDDKSGNEQTHHDLRLIRTAQELMSSVYPKDEYIISQKVVVK